jgi:hypothetical protein
MNQHVMKAAAALGVTVAVATGCSSKSTGINERLVSPGLTTTENSDLQGGGGEVHSSDSELENGQRAGSRIGAVRNLFGRSSINGFDFREAIGNPERGTPKQLGSATMNRGGS